MNAADGVQFHFSRRKLLLYATVIVASFIALTEGVIRLIRVESPVRARVVLRLMDVDIDFPFMQPDPDTFWSLRPGFKGDFLDHRVTINRLGLRGSEVSVPKPPNVRRIICYGDSITFGYGVNDAETYAARLARMIEPNAVEVINGGVTGFTSHQLLAHLKRTAPAVEAGMATVCIGWNDATRRPVTDREYARRLRTAMAMESVLDHSHIYRALKSAYVNSLVRRFKAGERTMERVPIEHYRENLEKIVAFCRKSGVRIAFIALPHRRRHDDPPLLRSPHSEALREEARALDVPFLEVGALAYESGDPSNESYFIDSLHLSALGNDYLASELAWQFEAIGWIDSYQSETP
jgi:lysophospholipase L1-like esterase